MLPTTGVSTNSHAQTFHTTTTCNLITVWSNGSTSPSTTVFPIDRPTSTDNYPCTDPSPRRCPRARAHEIYPVRSSPNQASQSLARHTASPPRGRCLELHVWQYIQPPLHGLDSGQIGQSGTVSRGDTGPQPPPCVATRLQRRPLLSCPCSLSDTRPRIFGTLKGS